MPKKNIPSYRLHKASGQAIVDLEGRTFYLGKYGSKASREEYERRIAEYLTNGRKLPPTLAKTGISCQELAIHFLEWAEEYYVKNGKPTETFKHCQRALSRLVQHYGNESVNEFSPFPLFFFRSNGSKKVMPGKPLIATFALSNKHSNTVLNSVGWMPKSIMPCKRSII